MKSIEELLNGVKILNGYNGMDVIVDIEERPEDIAMVMYYSDHGDDFLVVGTNDGHVYNYGLFANRPHWDLGKYVRAPYLFKELDDNGVTSNEIYFIFHNMMEERGTWLWDVKKYASPSAAQAAFDIAIRSVNDIISNSSVIVDYADGYTHGLLKDWLETNGISTEENLERINKLHNKMEFDGKLVVGIAGKEELRSSRVISCDEDEVHFLWRRGDMLDPERIAWYSDPDEWGFRTMYIRVEDLLSAMSEEQIQMDV